MVKLGIDSGDYTIPIMKRHHKSKGDKNKTYTFTTNKSWKDRKK